MSGATSSRPPLMLVAITLVTLAGLGARAPDVDGFLAAAVGMVATTLALYAALLPLYESALTRSLVLLLVVLADAFWLTVAPTLTVGEAAAFAAAAGLLALGVARLARRMVRP